MKIHNILFLFATLFIASCQLEDSPFISSDSSESGNGSGTSSGSYATMLTINNKLYVVTQSSILTYDVSVKDDPQLLNEQELGFQIESLLHYNGLLFIGSQSTMYIYKIGTDGIPERQSTTNYFAANDEICNSDPIFVKNNLAYVTLSTEVTVCGRSNPINELRIYDITNLEFPELKFLGEMSNPKGLGIGKSNLFVCDKTEGLVVFDLADPVHPVRIKTIPINKAYDLIIRANILMVVAEKELIQFDITNENDIKMLGTIEL